MVGTKAMIERGEYWFSYCGAVGAQNENTINLLKSLAMLQQLGSRQVTPAVIAQVIEEMNDLCEQKLCKGIKEVRVEISATIPWDDFQFYCESPTLSLPGPGIAFKTIMLNDRKDVPTFTQEALSEFLDICASFMNVDWVTPVGDADRAAQSRVLASPMYQRSRMRLLAICDHVIPSVGPASASAMDDDDLEEV